MKSDLLTLGKIFFCSKAQTTLHFLSMSIPLQSVTFSWSNKGIILNPFSFFSLNYSDHFRLTFVKVLELKVIISDYPFCVIIPSASPWIPQRSGFYESISEAIGDRALRCVIDKWAGLQTFYTY